MKKIFILFIILGCCGLGYYFITKESNEIKILDVEEEKVNISEYYTYGTSMNMTGSVKLSKNNFKSIKLTLYNGKFRDYDINYTEDVNTISFNLSDLLNEGLYLEDIDRGKYYMFIKVVYENEENKEEDIINYFVLDNNTEYNETIYYTLSNVNNKIIINSNNDYNTMMLDVVENTNDNIYDIVIDPGHGGMDGGAESRDKKYSETDFTLDYANDLKDKLEKLGLKVKLTWEENTLTNNELLEEYGKNGRAVVSSEVKAKYLFSIHFNSNNYSKMSGLEAYAPVNINYDFIKDIVNNITDSTGLKVSTGKKYKLFDGVYGRNFSESDIENSYLGYDEKGLNRYEISERSNYYYMIRETGGIVTGAYVDDRNDKIIANPYYNSNTGCESYILELGYITNDDDFNIIANKMSYFTDSIAKSVKLQIFEKSEKINN